MISIKNLFLTLLIIIISISIYYTKFLKLDASSDTLILDNDKTFEFYEYYNNIFPSRNFLVLAIKSNTLIDKEYIENINSINKQINNIKNVELTFSIVDAPILLSNNLELANLSKDKIQNINNNNKINLNIILDEFSSSPLFKDQIINSKKNLSSIIIYIKENKKFKNLKTEHRERIENNENTKYFEKIYRIEKERDSIKKENLINSIRDIINNQNKDYSYFLGGIDMITTDTIDFIKKDILIFSFAVLIFIIIVLFIIYRDIKWVIIPLISSIYAVLIMTSFMGLMNWEITAISSNFISLMLILSISMNIHIINHYKINYLNEKVKYKIIYTIQKMFWPCLYTILTTIVAFGSLLFSNIKPIIDFGNIMIIALIIAFTTSFTILPIIIYYFPKINKNKDFKFSILNTFYNLSIKKSKLIIGINIIIFLLSIYGITKLNVENSFINYFKSSTEIYKGMKLIDTELGGTTPMDIIIKFNDEKIYNSEFNLKEQIDENLDLNEDFDFVDELFEKENNVWFTKDKIDTIKKIHQYLESKKEIGKVQSLYSLIEMANLINKKQLDIFQLSILYNEIPNEYKENLIMPYLSIDNNMVKISSRIRDSNEINRNLLIKDINNFIESEFNNVYEFKVSGLLVLYNNMLQSLFSSQIKSFGIILFSIFIMFLILFQSFKISIIGIVPNIIASSFILGLIGICKIPLDIMTITIAAITIGIAVDNTIHYLYRIKENEINIKSTNELIKVTHEGVGKAVLTTSLTIAFGFSVLVLSNFIPTITFGLFTALAMIVAMLGVLVTLPSILSKFKI